MQKGVILNEKWVQKGVILHKKWVQKGVNYYITYAEITYMRMKKHNL